MVFVLKGDRVFVDGRIKLSRIGRVIISEYKLGRPCAVIGIGVLSVSLFRGRRSGIYGSFTGSDGIFSERIAVAVEPGDGVGVGGTEFCGIGNVAGNDRIVCDKRSPAEEPVAAVGVVRLDRSGAVVRRMSAVGNVIVGLERYAVIVLPCDGIGSCNLCELRGKGRVFGNRRGSRRPAGEDVGILRCRCLGRGLAVIFRDRTGGHGLCIELVAVAVDPGDITRRGRLGRFSEIEVSRVFVPVEPIAVAVAVRTEVNVVGIGCIDSFIIAAGIPAVIVALDLDLGIGREINAGQLILDLTVTISGNREFVIIILRPAVHTADKVVIGHFRDGIIIGIPGDRPDRAVRKAGLDIISLFRAGAVSEDDTVHICRDVKGVDLCPREGGHRYGRSPLRIFAVAAPPIDLHGIGVPVGVIDRVNGIGAVIAAGAADIQLVGINGAVKGHGSGISGFFGVERRTAVGLGLHVAALRAGERRRGRGVIIRP